MSTLNDLINRIISIYDRYNVLDVCYTERKINDDDCLVYVYFIPFLEGDTFYNIYSKNDCLNLESIIKKEDSIVYSKMYNWDKTLHVITGSNKSIYFNIVSGIYEFKDIDVLYKNVDTVRVLNDKEVNLVTSFEDFCNNVNLVYRTLSTKNKYVAFKYLTDAYGNLLGFLGNFYLNYSPDLAFLHFDFNDVLELMDERLKTNFKRIMDLMKVNNVCECTKLMLWFIDEYIGNLTISVVSRINIDYYDFVKGLF